MLKASVFPSVLLLFSLVGIYGAYLFGKKTRKFRWSEYIALLSAPVIAALSLSYFYGIGVVYLFVVSCFVGCLLEYLIGFAYHKTLNKRLWTYDRFGIHGYTSLLTFPMWGVAGVIFWFIATSLSI
jgi:uncharacterized membrane protein